MDRMTGMNTKERSELGYLLAGDFILNSKGKAVWRDTFPNLKEIRSEARRLRASIIFYDQNRIGMVCILPIRFLPISVP